MVIFAAVAKGMGKKQFMAARPDFSGAPPVTMLSGADQKLETREWPTPKKSPRGVSTLGLVSPSHQARSTSLRK